MQQQTEQQSQREAQELHDQAGSTSATFNNAAAAESGVRAIGEYFWPFVGHTTAVTLILGTVVWRYSTFARPAGLFLVRYALHADAAQAYAAHYRAGTSAAWAMRPPATLPRRFGWMAVLQSSLVHGPAGAGERAGLPRLMRAAPVPDSAGAGASAKGAEGQPAVGEAQGRASPEAPAERGEAWQCMPLAAAMMHRMALADEPAFREHAMLMQREQARPPSRKAPANGGALVKRLEIDCILVA